MALEEKKRADYLNDIASNQGIKRLIFICTLEIVCVCKTERENRVYL